MRNLFRRLLGFGDQASQVSFTRGPAHPIAVKAGEERDAFVAAVAIILECHQKEVDLDGPLMERYGIDDLEVYECVQRAEDIWQVRLLPKAMPVSDFRPMVNRCTTLSAIVRAAESARRAPDA
jgi:hypothetical protein